MDKLKVGFVVMAAGLSSRYGRNKLLAELEGRSLISRALDAVPIEKLDRVAVVTRFPEVLALAEARGFESVWNDHPEEGVSLTIRLGLERLCDMDAAVFMTGDQAWLSRASVSAMVDFCREYPGHIISMSYAGERGSPSIFPSALFPELDALRGDTGGCVVIRRHEDILRCFDVADAAELRDIDHPADLRPFAC